MRTAHLQSNYATETHNYRESIRSRSGHFTRMKIAGEKKRGFFCFWSSHVSSGNYHIDNVIVEVGTA